jgi:isoamylase
MEFARAVVRMRQRYKLLRSNRFLHGEPVDDNGTRSVMWFRPDGKEMDSHSWSDGQAKVVGLLLSDRTTRLLIIASAYHEAIPFVLPNGDLASAWQVRIDAGAGLIDPPDRRYSAGETIELEGRTLLLLAGEIG